MSFAATLDPITAPAPLARVTFVLGGARSGKSRFAEALVSGVPGRHLYLATAEAGDEEMAERIRQHRARRGAAWSTIEAPLDLAVALREQAVSGAIVLVDCLTLWLSNLLSAGRDPRLEGERLAAILPSLGGKVVLVSNEVGLGIVPDNALARAFRDHAGRLHQSIAAIADRVYFVAAGLPLLLKNSASAADSGLQERHAR